MRARFLRKAFLCAGVAGMAILSSLGRPIPAVAGSPKGSDSPPPRPEAWHPFASSSPIVAGAGVGYLRGDWNVTPDGAFNYRIPLDVPEGRAGMAPSLALGYSSASTATGLLGVGWTLEGLSTITRCHRNIAQDGFVDGVDFQAGDSTGDRFCLDGEKLVAVAGEYGQAGTEYRTEYESFSRIKAETGPDQKPRFIVETKSGTVREYAAVEAPRLQGAPDADTLPMPPQVAPLSVSDTVIDSWVLEREHDRSGNTIEYTWSSTADPAFVSNANGIELRLLSIGYTSNPALSMPFERQITFEYQFVEDFGDPNQSERSAFRSGVRSELRHRLSKIVMHSPTLVGIGENLHSETTAVWEYDIRYENSKSAHGRTSRIAGVRKCGLSSSSPGQIEKTCTWEKQFDWTDPPAGAPSFTTISRGTYALDIAPFDPNNVAQWAASLSAALQPPMASVLDLNGDGADDAIVQFRDNANYLQTHLLRGERQASGHFEPLQLNSTVTQVPGDHMLLGASRAINIDGDDRAELLALRIYETAQADGTVQTASGYWIYRGEGAYLVRDPGPPLPDGAWGDIDGDRLPDLLVRGAGSGDYWTHTGTWKLRRNVLGALGPAEETGVESRCGVVVTDDDGDSLDEFALTYDIQPTNLFPPGQPPVGPESPGDPQIPISQYTCRGFAKVTQGEPAGLHVPAPATAQLPQAGSDNAPYKEKLRLARGGDFNGDGLEDRMHVRRTGPSDPVEVLIQWNTGNGYGPLQPLPTTFFPAPIKGDWVLSNLYGDFNGDGRDDVLSLRRPPPFDGTPAALLQSMKAGGMVLALSNGKDDFVHLEIGGGAGLFEEIEGLRTTKVGDFDADGFADIMRFVPTQNAGEWELQLLMQDRHYADRIEAVKDEFTDWNRETVTYDYRWSDRTESNPGCSYPLSCRDSGRPVVREVASRAHLSDAPDADAGVHTLYYSYEDAVSDKLGRGYLGVRKWRIWDPSRPAETVFEYDNRFVELGRYYTQAPNPIRTTTVTPFGSGGGEVAPSGDVDVSDGVNARIVRRQAVSQLRRYNGDKTYALEPATWMEDTWEDQVAIDWGKVDSPSNPTSEHIYGVDELPPLISRAGDNQFDDFGNLLVSKEQTAQGASLEVVNTYENRIGPWLIGLPKSSSAKAMEGSDVQTRTQAFQYDVLGRLEAIHTEPGNPDSRVRNSQLFTYEPDGTLTRTRMLAGDPASPDAMRELRVEYAPPFPGQPDERIYPSQIWSPFDPVQSSPTMWLATHPAYGVTHATMDANGVQSQTIFDSLGRQVHSSVDGRADQITTYAGRPDAGGGTNGLIVSSSIGGQTRIMETDGLLRPIRSANTSFDGTLAWTAQAFDALGRLKSRSRPYAGGAAPDNYSYQYDALDRIVSSTTPLGEQTGYGYTFFTTSVRDPEGFEHGSERNVDGRTTRTWTIGEQGTIEAQFAYTSFGLLRQTTDDDGNQTVFDYDVLGRVVGRDDPNAGRTEFSYNGIGDLLTSTRAAIHLRTMSYDTLGRLINALDHDGLTTFEWDTAPNGIGRIARTTSPDHVVTEFDYDGNGLAAGSRLKIDNQTYSIGFDYDPAGNLKALSYPSPSGNGLQGPIVEFKRNAADAVSEIGLHTPGQPYQKLLTVLSRTLDDSFGTGVYGNGVTQTHGYDALGRIETISAVGAPNVPMLDITYGYFANGLLMSRTDGIKGRMERFGYDPLSRLKQWKLQLAGTTTDTNYGYDDVGNLESVAVNGTAIESNAFGSNGLQPHTLTTHSENGISESYVYDERGRQVEAPGRQVSYTEFDLPRQVKQGASETNFRYDANGRRVKKELGSSATIYVEGLYEKRSSAGNVEHVFHIPSPDGDVAQVVYGNGAYSVEYTLRDSLGSIGLVLDSSANEKERPFFDPFGKRINADGTVYAGGQSDVHAGFTGHENDAELALVNMRGRIYDARLKRFLTTDPFTVNPWDTQGWNPYSYVSNSPLNRTDPTGWQECQHKGTKTEAGCFEDGADGGGDAGGTTWAGGAGEGGVTISSDTPIGPAVMGDGGLSSNPFYEHHDRTAGRRRVNQDADDGESGSVRMSSETVGAQLPQCGIAGFTDLHTRKNMLGRCGSEYGAGHNGMDVHLLLIGLSDVSPLLRKIYRAFLEMGGYIRHADTGTNIAGYFAPNRPNAVTLGSSGTLIHAAITATHEFVHALLNKAGAYRTNATSNTTREEYVGSKMMDEGIAVLVEWLVVGELVNAGVLPTNTAEGELWTDNAMKLFDAMSKHGTRSREALSLAAKLAANTVANDGHVQQYTAEWEQRNEPTMTISVDP